MATSPNYSWPEPDNTDLVKNGALAMRTLGNAIDTTMATMTPKSIVDAKGDLIAATANDTPARLAVGTNFAFLQADSAESTGLVWNNAAWTSYTPTVTPNTGTGFTMTGAGFYTRIGKLCIVNYSANITTNGTGAGSIEVTLPFTGKGNAGYGSGTFRDNGLTGIAGFAYITTTKALLTFYNGNYPGANGAILQGTITYEVA